MTFFFLSFLAGVLTILAPCVLPLLPVVVGASSVKAEGRRYKAFTIIASLSVSIIVFTLLLKASTLLIDIPQSVWTWFSGTVIVLLGIVTLFPNLWSSLPSVRRVHTSSQQTLGSGYQKNSTKGDILVGVALGPVFTTCSPTYLFILATVLPTSFLVGFAYLISFTLGVALSLALVAVLGEKIVSKFSVNPKRAQLIKYVFGVIFIFVGIAIITGFDKKTSTYLLDKGLGGTVLFEEQLISEVTETSMNNETQQPQTKETNGNSTQSTVAVPSSLKRAFPDTDWSNADLSIEKALSGGPGKDGIPSINEPSFVPVSEYDRPTSVQAIVLVRDGTVKVYPYNILIWHEIVNDVIGDVPVAVTFCPLCGSAIVYNRELPQGETTFGVSGWLIESNLVMYDRDTESLFQQSTGKGVAGAYNGITLELEKFQLLTMKDVLTQYPDALVLSEDTGYARDYERNPYSGYADSDDFIFTPSTFDNSFPSKKIFVAFSVDDTPVAVPWLEIVDGVTLEKTVHGTGIILSKNNGELEIVKETGEDIPFYFEMWFSWAVQHSDNGVVLEVL